MKFTSSLIIMCLLGVTDARHRHHHHHRLHPRGDLIHLSSNAMKWDYSTTKFMDTDSYVKGYKDQILDDDEVDSGNKILEENDPVVIKNKLKLAQATRNISKKANQTKKAVKKEKNHYYDKIADDIQQFNSLEGNTMTADGQVRHSSDHFHFTDIESRTQSFVQKKQSQQQEESQRLTKIRASQEKETTKLTKDMYHQWIMFEKGLEVENWESARQMFAQLEAKSRPQRQLIVNTKKVYLGQFAFPQVAQNDYAIDQLNALEAAQNNLNDNPENETLVNRFIEVAQDTAENLLREYPGNWSDPSLEVKKERRQQQLAQIGKK